MNLLLKHSVISRREDEIEEQEKYAQIKHERDLKQRLLVIYF